MASEEKGAAPAPADGGEAGGEEKEPLNAGAKKEQPKSKKQALSDALKKSLCKTCGHEWHWTELFFIIMALVGVAIIAELNSGGNFPAVLVVLFGAVVSLVAFAYVWNLCPSRALALVTEELARNVKKMNEQNARALASCSKMKENNARFKSHINLLGESRKVIGKSAVSLDATAKKQEDLIAQTSALLERRIKFGQELRDLLSSANHNSTRQAMVNLRDMIMSELHQAEMDAASTAESKGLSVPTKLELAKAQGGAMQRVLERENIDWDPAVQVSREWE